MTPQIMRALKKLYRYENKSFTAQGEPYYTESVLSEKEKALLHAYGWKANAVERFTDHADTIEKLHTLKAHPHLTHRHCLDAFVAGVGGSYPRGLSALPAWYYLRNCPVHSYEEQPPYACCWVCGQRDEPQYIHDSYFQYCLYAGNAYAGSPRYAYLNLRHLAEAAPVAPTKADVMKLSALLDLVRAAPDHETPGQFEKRLREAKLLKGDALTKRGILNTLSLIGVIPNRFIALSHQKWTNFGDLTLFEKGLANTRGRSDMEMPWAGWQGALGLDEIRVSALFGSYFEVFP